MTRQVTASLRDISGGAKWRGHFDGLGAGRTLYGWALLGADPAAPLGLDLYIHDIHLATTSATIPRTDIDKILDLSQPADTGFRFDLTTLRPEGSLQFLRTLGMTPPKANLQENLRICIAGTQHRLPGGRSHIDAHMDLAPLLPALIRAAATQLHREIRKGKDALQLDIRDQEILLLANPLFSASWYAETFIEVGQSGLGPVEHYARFHTVLERAPGPWFDTESYLAALPKGTEMQLAPVIHYDIHGHDTWWPGQGRFRDPSPATGPNSDHALLIHLYHLDTVPDLQRLIASFPEDVDVFLSIPEDSPDHDPKAVAALFPRAREIFEVPNLGQDVAAFLQTVRHLKGRGYRFFCKVHSKKGDKYPEAWRRVMFDALAATPERVAETVAMFRSNPRVLMAGPEQVWLNGEDFDPVSIDRLDGLAARMGLGRGALNRERAFFAGTCFWIDAELAGMVADALTPEDFDEATVARDGQTAHAAERLFSLLAMSVGGDVALSDGCDWTAAPVIARGDARAGIRLEPGETTGRFLVRRLRAMTAPQIVAGTAMQPPRPEADDIFGGVDTALHGTIDVMVSCWNGRPEVLQRGLADLGRHLELQGLTWGALVSSPDVRALFETVSCRNLSMDSMHLRFPAICPDPRVPETGPQIAEDKALSLLRSQCAFLNADLPEGDELRTALADLGRLYAFWRGTLIRHKVRMFLIWGNTAPKSRMFIQLCQDLGIEYQIIERGHFPGTLSIDPMGQFGSGVHPRLVSHVGGKEAAPADAEARLDQIRDWYDAQQGNAAYADFQKRDTRDVRIMQQARAQGRPVLLVIGGNDQGGGIVGPDPDPLRVNWFGSSDGAFTLIRRLVSAKFPDALLVLRPHPSQAPQDAEFVLIARETALDDLIDASDLCITIGSTSRAICLLKDKPLLILGLSELNGHGLGTSITDETHLLAALRQHIWSGFADPYPDGANRRFVVELFDRHLIGTDDSVPTRHHMADLAHLLAGRIRRMKTGFLQDYQGREDQISQAMFEDVRDRGRAIIPVDRGAFGVRARPGISVVLPIYGDYEGTRICFDQLVRHQADNGYRVITVWDRGPDLRLRDLCLEYAEKAGFTYLENRENVGFSGTVNNGILHAGRDDIILLNSDTVPCGDWALRLQDAAYAHPKIGSVVPFSNNATIYNLAFPGNTPLPAENPVEWIEALDRRASMMTPRAVEMPVSHGYCTFVRRSIYDRLGLYSETKFDKGHSEDNEFSLRVRMAGYFCVCPTNVVMGHAGSTSFGDEVEQWKVRGREVLRSEFSHYFDEIRLFFHSVDPLADYRKQIMPD